MHICTHVGIGIQRSCRGHKYGALYVRACVRRGPAVSICIPGCGWGAGVGVGAEGTRITFVGKGKHAGAVAMSHDPQAGISESGLRVYST